ncbi:MAG: ferredoxin [Desulfovibrionales bacterium]
MEHRIEVFLDTLCCNGCGGCAEFCPEVFAMVDDKAALISEYGPGECIEEAAALCPMDCIEVGAAVMTGEKK